MKVLFIGLFILFMSSCRNDKFSENFYVDSNNSYYFYSVAETKFILGEYKEALKYYNKAEKLDPKDLFLKGKKAIVLSALGRKIEAKKILKHIINKGFYNKDFLILFVSLINKNEDSKLLNKIYDELIKENPKDKILIYKKSDLLILKKHYKKAIKLVNKYLKQVPNDTAMMFFLSSLYKKVGRYYSAKNVLNKIGSKKQNKLDAIVELLSLYRENSTNKDYLSHLLFLYKYNPNDFILYEMISSILKGLKAETGSHKYFIGVLSDNLPALEDDLPQEKSLYLNCIQALFDNKEYEVALESLRRANSSINDDDIHYATGIAYLNIEDEEDAESILKTVSSKSKFFKQSIVKIIGIYNNQDNLDLSLKFLKKHKEYLIKKDEKFYKLLLASVYENFGDYTKASKELKQLLKKFNDNVIRFTYASLLSKKGDLKSAIGIMNKIIKEDPNNINVLNYLAYTYAQINENLDDALDLSEKSIKLKPNDPFLLDTRAWIIYKQGYVEKAFKQEEALLKLFKKNSDIDEEILAHLIEISKKLDKKEKVKFYYLLFKQNNKTKKLLEKINKLIR